MFWRLENNANENEGDSGCGGPPVEGEAPTSAPGEQEEEGNDHADDSRDPSVATISLSPSLSPSKRAAHIMNATAGLCAHPLHFHSFAAVGSGGWVPTPKSLFAGAFQKCAACHGRLGGRASAACCNSEGGDAGAPGEGSNSSEGMLQCAACGAYAHRSCAFARPSRDGRRKGNVPPPCEVNLVEIQKAFGISGEQLQKLMGVPPPQSEAESNNNTTTNPEAEAQSSTWSIFGRRSTKKDEIDDSVLEEKKEPEPAEAPPAPTLQPGVLQTSFQLLQKTTETTRAIPKASALGMVAGGAAGLVIAGPAGVVVGSQIGRTVLAAGALVEGGLGVSVLVVSLAAAANFSSKVSLPSSSSSEKARQLKLNSTLVLVRPDIEVDPVWGEYAEEARKFWTEKNKESGHSSCGSFGLGHLFHSSPEKDERDVRYKKDSDIVKADASELPMKEKIFLLVARILNDKRSLPGYQYRYLILKHKRRTMFGDEGTITAEGHSVRSCRRDAHGVIKHVTATLLEVRPGLAASPAMTELSASAVEVLVFGELYDDVFKEIIQQTEEKDECLLAKVNELRNKSKEEGNARREDGEESSVSQSAIGALRALPQAKTPTDKLLHCVEFLEHVSAHFSSLFEGKCIDADTLLIMACQHVVAASVPHLHAEVAFVEEFARDEQLLSGKEGYALITLQASLHYLDSLDELPSDISPALAGS
ncbi:hypothetical protein ACHAXT_005106 [Thalassiosira profunda]